MGSKLQKQMTIGAICLTFFVLPLCTHFTPIVGLGLISKGIPLRHGHDGLLFRSLMGKNRGIGVYYSLEWSEFITGTVSIPTFRVSQQLGTDADMN